MATINLSIEGMHCAGCVNNITKTLQNTQGVLQVDVSLAHGNAQITFDEQQIQVEQLIDIIEELGFDVSQ